MRLIIPLLLFSLLHLPGSSQVLPDSIRRAYEQTTSSIEKGRLISGYVWDFRGDTAYLQKLEALLEYFHDRDDQVGEDYVQLAINSHLARTGDYISALNKTLEILNRFENRKDKYGTMSSLMILSAAYYYAGDREKDVLFGKKARELALELNDSAALASITNNIATGYVQAKKTDSAIVYAQESLRFSKYGLNINYALGTLGEIYIAKRDYPQALNYIRQSIETTLNGDLLTITWNLNNLAEIFLETGNEDSVKYYGRQAIHISSMMGYRDQQQRGYEYMARLFEKKRMFDSAFTYLRLAGITKDSLYSSEKLQQVQAILLKEQARHQEVEKEKQFVRNRMRTYSLLGGLGVSIIIVLVLYFNNRQKQKTNRKLENALSELKSTQAQLIQSEKMASLGELTAGIAHEIQNPLNFVNNFSEVSNELIDEMQMELDKGDVTGAKIIATDIKQNLEKINHHGKRADGIVKGMLQHSRTSSGKKEPTDINTLCDEYVRLSYHGLRAKDKTFNATIQTDFDNTIGKIAIIPQDIGRVILNILNNSFYAVNEKKKSMPAGYEPVVTLVTKKNQGGMQIIIKDNGPGIPDHIKEKIFQPFFTTKPTGSGTGLGLSLSYDIIKSHGGSIDVISSGSEGTTFIIRLNN